MWKEIDSSILLSVVASSKSIGECLDKLGITRGGKAYKAFINSCEKHGIDTSFPDRYKRPRTPWNEVFIKDSPYINNRINIKRWLLEAGVLENKCLLCGLGPEWNDKSLVLQLDHINGINNDHRVENLRILCPNCHTQTETYAGRRRS